MFGSLNVHLLMGGGLILLIILNYWFQKDQDKGRMHGPWEKGEDAWSMATHPIQK